MRNLKSISKVKHNVQRLIHGCNFQEMLKSSKTFYAYVLNASLSHYASRCHRVRYLSSLSSSFPTNSLYVEKEKMVLVSESVSRVFTPASVAGPFWQSCSCPSWHVLLDTSHSSLAVELSDSSHQQNVAYSHLEMFEGKPAFSKRLIQKEQSLKGRIYPGCVSTHFTSKAWSSDFSIHALQLRGCREVSTRRISNFNRSLNSSIDSVHNGFDSIGSELKRLWLHSGACCLPHPDKEKKGGEDAYFISSTEQVIGVADGVGGWADVGVDAGMYARELMAQLKVAIANEPNGCIEPARLLERAHSRTKCKGSATACILALSNEGLRAANLGDSGFIVCRNGQTVFKSPSQQHLFNFPYQLENGGSDPPSAAEVFCISVVAGDVLIVGTDGLFDNLYDHELISTVMHSTRAGLDPKGTARNLADLAQLRAQDRNRQTPFSSAAQDAGYRFYGGKVDDITVVVSYVKDSGPADNFMTL